MQRGSRAGGSREAIHIGKRRVAHLHSLCPSGADTSVLQDFHKWLQSPYATTGLDLQHQLARLRYAKAISDKEAALIYKALADHIVDYPKSIEASRGRQVGHTMTANTSSLNSYSRTCRLTPEGSHRWRWACSTAAQLRGTRLSTCLTACRPIPSVD